MDFQQPVALDLIFLDKEVIASRTVSQHEAFAPDGPPNSAQNRSGVSSAAASWF